MPKDNRPWAQTWSGRAFPLVSPKPSDVDWLDVAYGLAHANRFAGHAGEYTVAQHSIVVADALPPPARLYGLLHDAHEFILGDIPTPATMALRWYAREWANDLGERLMRECLARWKAEVDLAIYEAAGLKYPVPPEVAELVHVVDIQALLAEKRDLLTKEPKPWGFDLEPLPCKIVPLSHDDAFVAFKSALRECGLFC